MTKFISTFILALSALAAHPQDDLQSYLKAHHYSFSLDKGFDQPTADTLKQKLPAYKLILQAEGGSHYLNFYDQLRIVWLEFLNSNFGLTHFFGESGHTSDLLMNRYLQTGDTSYIYVKDKRFWNAVYAHNSNLPENNRLKYFGIDFERSKTYLKGLQLILPVSAPPENIKAAIDLIKNGNDTLQDCDYIISINSNLEKALSKYKQQFVQYFGENYMDFEKIVLNNGDCRDVYRDRNKNMASNFLAFDKDFNAPVYYGELGEAHTVLINKNTASYINRSSQFRDKVCVVNLYCYNCTTAVEPVSNWPLKNIEKDILEYFLPYCTSGFTLFDLSGKSAVTKKYSAYGQFLIVAENQN